MTGRIEWHSYFLGMAKYVSQRSTCPTRSVGSVMVDPETNAVLSMGYNGSPRGTSHCGEDCVKRELGANTKTCKAIHAEMNAILNAAFFGVKLRGATCYVSITPCLSCARALVQSGIREVIAAGRYPNDKAFELFKEANVTVTILSGISYPKITIRLPNE